MLNRYDRLRKHKRYLKQRHANSYCRWNIHEDERRERESAAEDTYWSRRHRPRNGGYEYWRNCYLSGCRRYAKDCTNSHIRAKYRQMALRNMTDEFLEDVVALKGSDYEKEYDYLWTIW